MIRDLTGCGADVCEVAAYRTVPDGRGKERVAELLAEGQINWITFTSSSTVRNFLAVVDVEAVRSAGPRLASIGPVTSATLREMGLEPTVEAKNHTIDGLVDSILEHERP